MELQDLDEPGHLAVRGVVKAAEIAELLQAITERPVVVLHLEDAKSVPTVALADALAERYRPAERAPLYVHVRRGSQLATQLGLYADRLPLRVVEVPIEDEP